MRIKVSKEAHCQCFSVMPGAFKGSFTSLLGSSDRNCSNQRIETLMFETCTFFLWCSGYKNPLGNHQKTSDKLSYRAIQQPCPHITACINHPCACIAFVIEKLSLRNTCICMKYITIHAYMQHIQKITLHFNAADTGNAVN